MSSEDIQKMVDNAKERAVKNFAEQLCEGRVESDPVVIAVNSLLEQKQFEKFKEILNREEQENE